MSHERLTNRVEWDTLSADEQFELFRTRELRSNALHQLLELIPRCEAHGHECLPHAKEWIKAQTRLRGLVSTKGLHDPYKAIVLGEPTEWIAPYSVTHLTYTPKHPPEPYPRETIHEGGVTWSWLLAAAGCALLLIFGLAALLGGLGS